MWSRARRGPELVLLLVLATTACRDTGITDAPEPPPGPRCGDGHVDPNESCDGSNLANHSCVSEGFDTGTIACAPDCFLDVSACIRLCGNGELDPGESCDGALGPRGPLVCGAFGFTACSGTCQVDASHCIPASGAFPDATSYPVPQGHAAAIAGPGRLGAGALVVAVPTSSQLELYPYSTTGSPDTGRISTPGTAPRFPLVLDLNSDDWPDIAFIGEEGQVRRAVFDPVAKSYVLAPLNDATACRARSWVGPLAWETSQGTDLVVLATCPATDADAPANALLLLPADGSGTPTPVDAPGITSAALGDLDGNGTTDILYTASGSPALQTLERGEAGFAPGPTYALGVEPPMVPTKVVSADFDVDGKVDVAVADGTQIVVLVRAGSVLEPRQTLPGKGTHLLAEDLDGDGRTDLAWLDTNGTGSAVVQVARNEGGFTFSEPIPLSTFTSGEPLSLSVGDLDADGDLDLAATLAQDGGSSTVVFRNGVR